MGDEKRLLLSAILILVVAALVFAITVVHTTKSRLGIGSGDPLLNGSSPPGEECGELMAAAAKAVESGHPANALESLQLIETLPCGRPFLVRAVQLYRAIDRPRDAVFVLNRLLNETPENPELLCEMAAALHEAGHTDSARAFLEQAAGLPGLESKTVRTLAWLAMDHGDSLLAESFFSRALDVGPDDPELWRALSQIRLNVGKALQAKEAAQRAIALDPQLCSAHLSLGWAHETLGEVTEADSAFRHARRICPDEATVLFESGRFYFRSGETDKAVHFLRRAVEGASSPVEWFLLLARAESRLGEESTARQTLKLACTRHNGDYRPFLLLARLERRAGNTERSRLLALDAQSRAPDCAEVTRFLDSFPG